jgi:hypothetical protein
MILAGNGGILSSRTSRSTNTGSGSFTTHLLVQIRSSYASIKKVGKINKINRDRSKKYLQTFSPFRQKTESVTTSL